MMHYTSKIVKIGNLLVGGDYPVRIQSMTNTNTLDTVATVNQAIRMIQAGSELVRITAPGIREAENLDAIKRNLHSKGFRVPLIADIHFNPKAAEIAATIVEKVRINPGNYIGKASKDSSQKGGKIGLAHYTDGNYMEELDSIRKNLSPLLSLCRQYGTAIRIGVNHGSLGDRIVDRYGDTVEGMVVSALEYARICAELNFHNLVLSVKSSNTVMMLNAYRELALRLKEEGLNYPLHIGVTEAGDGEDGRLKSIAGIGAVLSHGIGDTIRVSLTEEPEAELPVAAAIVKRYSSNHRSGITVRRVRKDLLRKNLQPPLLTDRTVFGGFPKQKDPVALILKNGNRIFNAFPDGRYAELNAEWFINIDKNTDRLSYSGLFNRCLNNHKLFLIVKLPADETSKVISQFRLAGCSNPVFLVGIKQSKTYEEMMIENCLHPGALLMDGMGQGLCLDAGNLSMDETITLGYGILQATRSRFTRTDYIACPSCGRTHFNIQQRLLEVKAATSHLTGLKIAVMGCIVNGPGEMADADYGYVGAGKGKVTLYKGKEVIKQSIPENEAVEELLRLIEK